MGCGIPWRSSRSTLFEKGSEIDRRKSFEIQVDFVSEAERPECGGLSAGFPIQFGRPSRFARLPPPRSAELAPRARSENESESRNCGVFRSSRPCPPAFGKPNPPPGGSKLPHSGTTRVSKVVRMSPILKGIGLKPALRTVASGNPMVFGN